MITDNDMRTVRDLQLTIHHFLERSLAKKADLAPLLYWILQLEATGLMAATAPVQVVSK